MGTLFAWGLLLCLPLIYGVEYCQRINPPWVKFEDNCYLFHQDWKARVSFHDAEDACLASGGHLASIHSEAENNFFLDMAKSGVFRGRQWIGLNIFKGNDTPEWTDGTPVDYKNITPKPYYKNEKCFIYMLDKKGWRPEDCGLRYPPTCKRPFGETPVTIPPPTIIPPPKGYCPKGWIQFERKCYKYFGTKEEDRVQYKQARDACWALGKDHDLVSIHSMNEQAFLTQHMYDFGGSAWIGMHQLESDEIGHDIVFGWMDQSRSDFAFWAIGHPPPGTWKYCGRLNYEGVAKGEWIADYCEIEKRGYICQAPADPSLPPPVPELSKCESTATEYRNSCYQYFSVPETHEKAEQSCKKSGGHLVSILDGFEQAFLYNFIGNKSKSVWNGLGSVQNTLYLRWTDKQPFYYSNWVKGAPQLERTKQVCSYLDSNSELKWNLTDCSNELPYICEISDEKPRPFPEVLGKCPGDDSSWVDIGDEYCYHVAQSKNHILSWDSTFRYCLSKGMQMLITKSNHKIDSLVSYFWKENKTINLGMIKKFETDSFIWVDGNPLEFTNWDNREPNNYPEEKACVALDQKTGKWKAISCSGGGVTVCQAAKIPYPLSYYKT